MAYFILDIGNQFLMSFNLDYIGNVQMLTATSCHTDTQSYPQRQQSCRLFSAMKSIGSPSPQRPGRREHTATGRSPQTRRLRTRRLLGLTILVALLSATTLGSILLGARPMPLAEAWNALWDLPALLNDPNSGSADARVIADLRWPRTVLGLIVGAALGVAGALIQGHTRNPLADPGLLGVSSGAAFAVVLGFFAFGVTSVFTTSAIAFGGATLATAIVFGLASLGRGTINPLTLILGGAALTAVLNAMTTALTLMDQHSLDRMRFWAVGSLAGRDLSIFWGTAPLILLGLIVALASAPTLNLLNLGDDAATALGVNTDRARILGMVIISLLAGAATAAAGPLGFIGLVVPHIARSLCGPDYRWILPYAALIGATLLLLSDILGRIITRPGELQVGIVLAFVGAPFFMYLIYRRKVVSL